MTSLMLHLKHTPLHILLYIYILRFQHIGTLDFNSVRVTVNMEKKESCMQEINLCVHTTTAATAVTALDLGAPELPLHHHY